MHVIGTAGHVDHGKSTLIEALTGVHPDRLKEEQLREMTIELGFGWLSLQDGTEVGLVDVPGHIDFIGNLMSGVGGIDAVLFVIAADEGIMPQTREHEAIIRLLQIPRGILVLTKIDLAPDTEWLAYIKEEIRNLFSGSSLADAPILEVSARTGQGMKALKGEIDLMVKALDPKTDYHRPRLPVDRVFQLQGIGTVVTGTLMDGEFVVGDQIEILPRKKNGRIRELQIHRKKVGQVPPGNRTAVNLSGISIDDVERGDIIARIGSYQPTQRLDIWVQVLKGIVKPLTHNSKVRLYLGTKSVSARVRVIGQDHISAGGAGFLQLELEEPVIAMKGDRLILRRFSPGETLGGGSIVNSHPAGRHKRFSKVILAELDMLSQQDPAQLLEQFLEKQGASTIAALTQKLNLSHTQTEEIVTILLNKGSVFQLSEGQAGKNTEPYLMHHGYWQRKRQAVLDWLTAYHDQYPWKPGATLLQLREKFAAEAVYLNTLLQSLLSEGLIVRQQNLSYAMHGFVMKLSPRQQSAWATLQDIMQKSRHTPPSTRELSSLIGAEMLKTFQEAGLILRVSDDLVYLPEQIRDYEQWLLSYFASHDSLSLGDFKDTFDISRKYALAVLEFFDRVHMTERVDNVRKLYKRP
jgi:selenocysteine-specific elongation factor